MSITINEVDKVEILTLQDNYIDLLSQDNSQVVLRAMPIKDMEIKNSILAEHGFSSVVTITKGDETRSVLFDFGFSSHGAAFNSDVLGVDLGGIEVAILSHGHLDHIGGMTELIKRTGKNEMALVMHPEALREGRFLKSPQGLKIRLPSFTREKAKEARVILVETEGPYPILDGDLFFLGRIPRVTEFERGAPNLFYMKNGEETWDDLLDDTAIVAHVRGKGLVVLSGCAHSGIVNTVLYAKDVSQVQKVFTIMGGFHLSGPQMGSVIEGTIQGLKEIDPTYIIPAHCTGRNAIMRIEKEMPDRFILNMAGTKLTFQA